MTKAKTLDALRKVKPALGLYGIQFSPLRLEHLQGNPGAKWNRDVWYRLTEPLVMVVHLNGGEPLAVSVPAGFETNLASIPWWLQWRFRCDGPWAEASVIHDYLYGCGQCSRFLADSIFRAAMEALGCWEHDALVMFYALRLSSTARKAWKKGKHS